jgi:hypothetical protein
MGAGRAVSAVPRSPYGDMLTRRHDLLDGESKARRRVDVVDLNLDLDLDLEREVASTGARRRSGSQLLHPHTHRRVRHARRSSWPVGVLRVVCGSRRAVRVGRAVRVDEVGGVLADVVRTRSEVRQLPDDVRAAAVLAKLHGAPAVPGEPTRRGIPTEAAGVCPLSEGQQRKGGDARFVDGEGRRGTRVGTALRRGDCLRLGALVGGRRGRRGTRPGRRRVRGTRGGQNQRGRYFPDRWPVTSGHSEHLHAPGRRGG